MYSTFNTLVAGATKTNPDGTSRQKIIKKIAKGESLELVREPENPYDENAVAVFRKTGEQVGYISRKYCETIAYHMDRGGEIMVTVDRIVIESSLPFLGWLFGHKKCIITVARGIRPYVAQDQVAYRLVKEAESLEKTDTERAIALYRESIPHLKMSKTEFEKTLVYKRGIKKFKCTKYPINRLSLLLERASDHQACLKEIGDYFKVQGSFPISKADVQSVEKRKVRVEKRLVSKKP